MKSVLICLLMISVLSMGIAPQLMAAENSRALAGVDLASAQPLSDAEAQQIKGQIAWIPILAVLSLVAIAAIYAKLIMGKPLTSTAEKNLAKQLGIPTEVYKNPSANKKCTSIVCNDIKKVYLKGR